MTLSPLDLNVVLVTPQIPPNTGNIGRLCLATGCRLHLVGPLGFSLDEKSLRRAGMDYWKEVDLVLWEDWESFHAEHPIDDRAHLFSTKAEHPAWDASYQKGDYLIFGSETRGLPESLLRAHPGRARQLPMVNDIRSLNLATSVGAAVYLAAASLNRRPSPT